MWADTEGKKEWSHDLWWSQLKFSQLNFWKTADTLAEIPDDILDWTTLNFPISNFSDFTETKQQNKKAYK